MDKMCIYFKPKLGIEVSMTLSDILYIARLYCCSQIWLISFLLLLTTFASTTSTCMKNSRNLGMVILAQPCIINSKRGRRKKAEHCRRANLLSDLSDISALLHCGCGRFRMNLML